MKKLLLYFLLFTFTFSLCLAQDTIALKNGKFMLSSIINDKTDPITYRYFIDSSQTIRSFAKSEIAYIRYANGKKLVFGYVAKAMKPQTGQPYGQYDTIYLINHDRIIGKVESVDERVYYLNETEEMHILSNTVDHISYASGDYVLLNTPPEALIWLSVYYRPPSKPDTAHHVDTIFLEGGGMYFARRVKVALKVYYLSSDEREQNWKSLNVDQVNRINFSDYNRLKFYYVESDSAKAAHHAANVARTSASDRLFSIYTDPFEGASAEAENIGLECRLSHYFTLTGNAAISNYYALFSVNPFTLSQASLPGTVYSGYAYRLGLKYL